MSTQIFDGAGVNLGTGPALVDLDLRRWPACRVIGADADWNGTVDLIVILADNDPRLSADALAHGVAVGERGGVVALHARDDGALLDAASTIFGWVGGAHV